MSSTVYGTPVASAITQSILPVMLDTGKIVGFYLLSAPIVYSPGTPPPVILSNGTINPKTVNPPAMGNDGSFENFRLSQYVAAVYPQAQENSVPWTGFTEFVRNDNSGLFAQWSLPTIAPGLRTGLGTLLTSIKVNMNTAYTPPAAPGNPSAVSGQLRWATALDVTSANLESGFFDFNWYALFQAAYVGANPLRITTLTNPAGGQFKASIVSASGMSILPGGAAIFDTIRIIKLNNAPAAAYVFTFAITDTNNLTTNVTLTLNVV